MRDVVFSRNGSRSLSIFDDLGMLLGVGGLRHGFNRMVDPYFSALDAYRPTVCSDRDFVG